MVEGHAIKCSSPINIMFLERKQHIVRCRMHTWWLNCHVTGEKLGNVGKGQSLCDTVLNSQSKQLQNHSLPVDSVCSIAFLNNLFEGKVEICRLDALRINYFNKSSIKAKESYL